MKREGRQHGMVRAYYTNIIPSNRNRKPINELESPATAGIFTRVSQKPTNHSKFTGKCGRPRCVGCHMHPADKSKDKTKGTQKLKSCDVVTNYRLVTWRVVDAKPGLSFKGFSATGILDHLANDYVDDGDDIDGSSCDDDDDDADGVNGYGCSGSYSYADWKVDSAIASTTAAIRELDEIEGDYKEDGGGDDGDGRDDDERLSFCDVGFIWEQVEGDVDGWCLVEEI